MTTQPPPQSVASIVDGRLAEACGTAPVTMLNPSDESLLPAWLPANEETVDEAVNSAQRALETWSMATPRTRSGCLLALAARLEEDGEALAQLDSANVGMPIAYARRTIEAAIDTFRFFAGAARTATAPAAGNYTGSDLSWVSRSPIGVVGAFLPWNVPTLMAAWKLAPAIAAGNSVVAKPSELTPYSTLRIAEHAREVFPPGVLNVVLGSPDDAAGRLLEDDRVRMITLTGGTRAGKTVGELAARTVKRVHLELGGKGLAIVCEDADIEHAAQAIVQGALHNSGQDCTAASRVMTVSSVADTLIERMGHELQRVRIGPAQEERSELGPLITRDRLEHVGEFVNELSAHATIVAQTVSLPDRGFFMAPVLAYGLDPDSPLCTEEVFAPVVTVEVFDSLDELMAQALQVKHRLGASLWTGSVVTATRIVESLPMGKIWVNNHHVDALEMPHSGSWLSGYGIEQSIYAMEAYQVLKTVYSWRG